jgi:DNA-binding GntR family transcriptional regulator
VKIAADAAIDGVNGDHVSSVTRAFNELRELIVLGHLPPGGWIIESVLAERLGVSRTPIRSALHWLRREGYVVEHAGRRNTRVIVAPLTRDDAQELYRIVGHLEALAGAEVVALPARARAKIAGELAAINQQLHAIASERPVDPRRVFDVDKAFHARIVEAAGGRRLTALHNSVRPQVDRYWRLYASSIINELHRSVAEHDEIVGAVRTGDIDDVRRTLDRNWAGGFERISGLIEIFGERGSW